MPAQAAEPQKQPSAEPAAAPKPARKPNVVYDDPEQKAVLDLISVLFQCDAAHDLLDANCTAAFGNIVKRRFSADPFCDEVHVDIDRQALRSVVVIAGNRAIECGNLVRAEEILESSLTVFRQDRVIEYNLACAASLMGKLEKSMAMLRLAVQHGYNNLNHLRTDPDLAAVRAHPQFHTLVEPLRTAAAPAATSAPIAATMIQPAVVPVVSPIPAAFAPQQAAVVQAAISQSYARAASGHTSITSTTPQQQAFSRSDHSNNDLASLLAIFPTLPVREARKVLKRAKGDIEVAANYVLGR